MVGICSLRSFLWQESLIPYLCRFESFSSVAYPARKKRHNQRREPASASRQSRISAPPRSANGKSASSQALSQEKTRLLTSDGELLCF